MGAYVRTKTFLLATLLTFGVLFFQNCSEVGFKTLESSLAVVPQCQSLDIPDVQPKLKWDWYASLDKDDPNNFPAYSQVMSTPMVADLNGDNRPKVVFSTFSVAGPWHDDVLLNADGSQMAGHARNGVLRIVDGATGQNLASIQSKELAPSGDTSPLLIDLDGDGKIEIVYVHYRWRFLVALNSDGSFRWKYETGANLRTIQSVASADLNKDGKADILLPNEVISENSNGLPESLFSLEQASHINQFAYSLDPSTPQELHIVSPRGVYDSTGKVLSTFSGPGYITVADIDKTSSGLEVIANGGGLLQVRAGLTGELLNSIDLTPINELTCSSGNIGGGAPTIGDFDGDPKNLEVGIATGKYLIIFDQELNLVDKFETQDCSSLSTGISSFDFNGDKKPEILYADEEYLRIFELKNGKLKVVAQIINPSGTLNEYPVVVDVDGNGSSELILAANSYAVGSFYKGADEIADVDEARNTTGVRAFESQVKNSWMPTRKIWNQYSYNPALVTDSGKPTQHTPFGATSLFFRRNTQFQFADTSCKSAP